MPAADRLDMLGFITRQRRERYRAFVLHGPPLSGKSAFARELASRIPAGHYLNLLDAFAGRPDLAAHVDTWDAAALLRFAVDYANEREAACLLVDDLDFLVHAWNDDLAEFRHQVEKLAPGLTPAAIGFVLQTQPGFESWRPLNSSGQSRVIALDGIAALPSTP
jgi:hypothetical protein